jgi:hypothetical protein
MARIYRSTVGPCATNQSLYNAFLFMASHKGNQPQAVRLLLASLGAFLIFSLSLWLTRPETRSNMVQNFAMLFFVTVLLSQLLFREQAAQEISAGNDKSGLLLAMGVGALVYIPALGVYFVSDDFVHLQKAMAPLLRIIREQFTQGQVEPSGYHLFFRPLGFASLALDYRLWHTWAPGHHLVSILLHLCVIAGVFFFCRALELSASFATTAALLFAVLPINVQAVTYIAARFDMLATALTVWALVFYARFRMRGAKTAYGLALGLFLLATCVKESAYVLPFLLLLVEVLLLRRLHIKPVLGFVAVAGLSFLYRLHTLHGIGGYQMAGGSPAALTIGRKTLTALFVRAPSEALLGYNWLAPGPNRLVMLAAATAALLFALAATVKVPVAMRRYIWFSLCWLIITPLPAHSLLWNRDESLLFSRVIYLPAVGVALLLATILEGISERRLRQAFTAALTVVFILGLSYNLSAWRANSRITRQFLADLKRIDPSPPAGAEFVILDLPDQVYGVRFFYNGLTHAVQLDYDRNDLTARRSTSIAPPSARPVINLQWSGGNEGRVLRASP